MLGGRGPTGSPLLSQTPRFSTWTSVRLTRSFLVAGITAGGVGIASSRASISCAKRVFSSSFAARTFLLRRAISALSVRVFVSHDLNSDSGARLMLFSSVAAR